MTTPSQRDYDERASIRIAEIGRDLSYIKEKLTSIETQVSSQYVSKDEFDPIKRIVYGLVGLILISVAGALLGLVLNK
jgi:hypothetical protein